MWSLSVAADVVTIIVGIPALYVLSCRAMQVTRRWLLRWARMIRQFRMPFVLVRRAKLEELEEVRLALQAIVDQLDLASQLQNKEVKRNGDN